MHRYLFNILLIICIVISFLIGKYHIFTIEPGSVHVIVNILIFCIFFTCGIMIPLDKLENVKKYLRLTSFTLFFSFVIYPVVGVCVGYFMTLINFNKNLLYGFLMVCFMPPPISAGVILTQGIDGNESLAIVNSIIGNLVGIVLSPLLLHRFLLNAVDVPQQGLCETILHILTIIILPLIIGRIFSQKMNSLLIKTNYRENLSNFNKILLLGVLFMTFLDMFQHQECLSFGMDSVAILSFSIVLIQTLMILAVFGISSQLMIGLANSNDMYAIVYAASLKSLGTGMVILHSLLSSGGDFSYAVNRAETTLPLMLFEPIQIFIGSAFQPVIVLLFSIFKNSSSDSDRRDSLLLTQP